jgi:hypothetical protein
LRLAVLASRIDCVCAEFSGTLLGFDDFVSMFYPLPL